MKENRIISAVLVVVGVMLTIPPPVFSGWADDREQIRKAFLEVKSIKTDFVQHKNMKIFSRPFVSKGRFFYRASADIRWEYESPIRSVLLLSSGNVKRFTWREGAYSQDSGAGMEAMGIVLQDISGWLSGDFESSSTFTAELKPGPAGKIILYPRDKSLTKFIQRVELTLSATPGVLKAVEIVEGGDASTHIDFSNTEINLQFPDGLFTDAQ